MARFNGSFEAYLCPTAPPTRVPAVVPVPAPLAMKCPRTYITCEGAVLDRDLGL